MSQRSSNLLLLLASLRWWSGLGQTIAIGIAVGPLGLALDGRPLAAGVVALLLFNLWAVQRARSHPDAGVSEGVTHLAADIAVLSWQLAWSGGVTNPFTSLLLLPVALAAFALPFRAVLSTAALAVVGYLVAAEWGAPLPHAHGLSASSFDLHLAGMAVNFVLSVATMTWFGTRLARTLARRDAELAHLSERFARDEGIVALATQAASVAHELNTPLASMTLLLEELATDAGDPASRRDDLAVLAGLVETCRQKVQTLAMSATDAPRRTLTAAVEAVLESWRVLRPDVPLHSEIDLGTAAACAEPPGFGHLLQVLLNNAADASLGRRRDEVELALRADAAGLVGHVRDHGGGMADDLAPHLGRRFGGTKPDGLGVGLVLSHASIERLGGELRLAAADGGGTVAHFRIPLSTRQPS